MKALEPQLYQTLNTTQILARLTYILTIKAYLPNTSCLAFNETSEGMLKILEKRPEREQVLEWDSGQIFEIIIQEISNNYD